MDEEGRFTAEHSVMEAGIEIRELKHLLEIKDDKIKKLQAEIVRLKASQRHNITIDGEPLHSVASEKYNKFGDKSLLDSDDEEPNNESY